MDKIELSDSTRKKESPEQRELENLSSSEQSKHKTTPRNSDQKSQHPKQKGPKDNSILVALIGLIGVIVAAVLYNLPSIFKIISSPTPTSTVMSAFTPTVARPTISISSDVRDSDGNHIDMNSAPFQVSVQGTVSNSDGYYVYLIVANKYHHYVQPIQPGVGTNVGNEFSNLCQLGEEDNPDSYGQQYTIYAVVTDKPYTDFAFFEGEQFIAKSKELKITRKPIPAPTSAP